jgi:septal ring-binding cell division protein DamX
MVAGARLKENTKVWPQLLLQKWHGSLQEALKKVLVPPNLQRQYLAEKTVLPTLGTDLQSHASVDHPHVNKQHEASTKRKLVDARASSDSPEIYLSPNRKCNME